MLTKSDYFMLAFIDLNVIKCCVINDSDNLINNFVFKGTIYYHLQQSCEKILKGILSDALVSDKVINYESLSSEQKLVNKIKSNSLDVRDFKHDITLIAKVLNENNILINYDDTVYKLFDFLQDCESLCRYFDNESKVEDLKNLSCFRYNIASVGNYIISLYNFYNTDKSIKINWCFNLPKIISDDIC